MTRRIVVTNPDDPPADGQAPVYDEATDTWSAFDRAHDHSDELDGDALLPVEFTLPHPAGPIFSAMDDGRARWLTSGAGAGSLVIGTGLGTDATLYPADSSDPEDLTFGATADPGTAVTVARLDHIHGMPAEPTTDHGELDGLTDDDHTQYLLASGARDLAGDLVPDADGTRDLGNTTDRFGEAHVDAVYTDVIDDAGGAAGIEAKVGIWPGTDSALDLGKSGKTWQHVWAEGIQFPATQVPSANANNLDDYKEGEWTPTYDIAVGKTGAAATTTSVGQYQKVGRWVTVQCYILGQRNTLSAGTTVIVQGLPFPTANVSNGYQAGSVGYFDKFNIGGGAYTPLVFASPNVSYVSLALTLAGGIAVTNWSTLGTDSTLMFEMRYLAAD